VQIAGWEKNSFVDFPGRISCVIFAPGCNFDCWYCHNAGIRDEHINFSEILAFLERRKKMIDGVVFSGGEATLQKDLKDRMKDVKSMGFLVKLDTNGTNPEILKELIDSGLVDYVAMDIKAPKDKYESIVCRKVDMNKIQDSIDILMQGRVDYEFRTTFSPDLLHEDIRQIAKWIAGAKHFSIQQYRTETHMGKLNKKPHEPEYVRQAAEIASAYVKTDVKGL